DLLGVLAIATIPGLLVDLDLLVAQDLVHLGDHVLADDPAEPHGLDVLGWDHDGHVALQEAEHVELLLRPGDRPALDALDDADSMCRIHDLFPNFKRHKGGTLQERGRILTEIYT